MRCPVSQIISSPKHFRLPSSFWVAWLTTGQWERPLTKLCSLHFLTRLLLSFLTTASCGTVSRLGPCQGLIASTARAPLDLKKKFLETSRLGPIRRVFTCVPGGAKAFSSQTFQAALRPLAQRKEVRPAGARPCPIPPRIRRAAAMAAAAAELLSVRLPSP